MKKSFIKLLFLITIILFSSCIPSKVKVQTTAAPAASQTPKDDSIFEKEYLFFTDGAVKDKETKAFGNISGFELTKQMTVGWNLGNTFDATGTKGLGSE